MEGTAQAICCSSITNHEILIAPFLAKDVRKKMLICNCRDAIVASKLNQPPNPDNIGGVATISRVVCAHDTPNTSIHDRPFERGQPTRSQVNKNPHRTGRGQGRIHARSTQVPLASLNRTSVETLLWHTESRKVLNHC